ncbi:MAG: hypothetical protein KF724_01745 [Phycisphaeraceae bacterium]|nr:hypothetical protein [Phycisphaeraceae bacterium]
MSLTFNAACVQAMVIRGALLSVVLAAGGCANPFLNHYQGTRAPRVSTAHVAILPPQNATLLGTSDFLIETVPGDPEAIAAAEAVGADIVQWDRALLRQETTLHRQSLSGDGFTDGAPGAEATELPVVTEGAWYRIHARFWRSESRGGVNPPAPAE